MELELEKNINKTEEINTKNKELNNLDNNLENKNDINNIVTNEKQNNFLDSMIGKTINTALNIGIRYLLPNVIENQVIEIKDTILKEGFKEGLNKTIDEALNLGKSAIGIFTGKFDNVTQIQSAIEKGGLIDTISDSIDFGLEVAKQTGILPKNVEGIIKSGKNIIMNNIESNIENTLTQQLRGIEKVNTYIVNWNKYYNQKNFHGMQLEYDKIREKLKELVPLEQTLQKAHQVENLHKLIKSKGQDFNLSEEEIELAKKL